MRYLYTFIWYLLLPGVIVRLLLLSRSNPAYRQRLAERFGFIEALPAGKKTVWVHAVSVGETQAAVPLVDALLREYPDHQILITTTTPTGAAHVQRCFQDAVQHRYLAYDMPSCVRRFLQRARPAACLVMETELWPNLFHACRERSIPVAIINARLSAASCRRYRWLQSLTGELLGNIRLIACRSEVDAQRFKELGAREQQLQVTGNIKFDIQLTESEIKRQNSKRRELFGDRPVWIAASTHAGEEEVLLTSHQALLSSEPGTVLVLAPRHPERCPELEGLVRGRGLVSVNHSEAPASPGDAQIYILDTLGELRQFYGLVDIVFMGGSLIPSGGHNFIEPAVWGRPLLSGPHYFNFQEVAEPLQGSGALRIVQDGQQLSRLLGQLFQDSTLREHMGEQARIFVTSNQGSTNRVMQQVGPWLE